MIAIIMVVAANTMAMTARERMSEYATFKALGFDGFRIGTLVWGESLTLTAAGGALGMALTFPAARYFESQLGQFFPVFQVSHDDAADGRRGDRRRRRRGERRAHLAGGAGQTSSKASGTWGSDGRRLMAIPYSYSLRNLWTRRLTTALTAAGMAMVVFVFAAMQMLAAGLRATLVETGSYDNAVLIRKSSQTEVQSSVARDAAAIVEAQPEVAVGAGGERLVAKEIIVLISLLQRRGERPANVTIRGIGPASLALRPQVRLKAGRMPKPGSAEIAAGASIARRFRGAGIGERLRFAQRDWLVVGILDAGGSAFDSEIWGDVDQLMQAFRRPVYSSVLLRLRDPSRFDGAEEAPRGRPAPRARGQAGDALLRRPVGDDGEVPAGLRRGAGGDLLLRRDHRRDDHDVRGRRQPGAGDRDAARAGLPAREHPRGIPARGGCFSACSAASAACSAPRSCSSSPSRR